MTGLVQGAVPFDNEVILSFEELADKLKIEKLNLS